MLDVYVLLIGSKEGHSGQGAGGYRFLAFNFADFIKGLKWPSQAKPLPVDKKADPKKQKSIMTLNLLVVLY